jgi:hypothetical protein
VLLGVASEPVPAVATLTATDRLFDAGSKRIAQVQAGGLPFCGEPEGSHGRSHFCRLSMSGLGCPPDEAGVVEPDGAGKLSGMVVSLF